MKIVLEVDNPYQLLEILRAAGGQPSFWADQVHDQIQESIADLEALEQARVTYEAWQEEGLGTCLEIDRTNYPDAWEDMGNILRRP